jgi:hypothetical protein
MILLEAPKHLPVSDLTKRKQIFGNGSTISKKKTLKGYFEFESIFSVFNILRI